MPPTAPKPSKRSLNALVSESPSTPMDVEPNLTHDNFVQTHLLPAVPFGKPLPMAQFELLKCGKLKADCTNFYMLISKQERKPPRFQMSGVLNTVITTPFLVIANRSSHAKIKIDQYRVVLTLDSDDYTHASENMSLVKNLYETHPSALFEISKAASFRQTRDDYDNRPVPLEMFGFRNVDELYASKTVASPHTVPTKHPMHRFVPDKTQPHTAALKLPSGFELRSSIPVFEKNGEALNDERCAALEDMEGTLFFYLTQQAYSGKIYLKVEPIALTVDTTAPESPAKKARLESLL